MPCGDEKWQELITPAASCSPSFPHELFHFQSSLVKTISANSQATHAFHLLTTVTVTLLDLPLLTAVTMAAGPDIDETRGLLRGRGSNSSSSRRHGCEGWRRREKDIAFILLLLVGVYFLDHHEARGVHGPWEVWDEDVHVAIYKFVCGVVGAVAMARDATHIESREGSRGGEEERKVLEVKELSGPISRSAGGGRASEEMSAQWEERVRSMGEVWGDEGGDGEENLERGRRLCRWESPNESTAREVECGGEGGEGRAGEGSERESGEGNSSRDCRGTLREGLRREGVDESEVDVIDEGSFKRGQGDLVERVEGRERDEEVIVEGG
jgi:hypothetical protein